MRVLPARLARPLGVVAVVAAAALLALAFAFAGESTGAAADLGVRASLRQLGAPWHQIALVIDWTGEPVGAAVVLTTMVVAFLRLGHRRAAVLAVLGTGAAVVVTSGMKPVVGRTINDGFLSFPSGHTAGATAFALVTMLVVAGRRQWGALPVLGVALLAAAAMAWAQVLLNAHYPTDTLGGFCTTLVVVPVVAWGIDRVAEARRTGGTPA